MSLDTLKKIYRISDNNGGNTKIPTIKKKDCLLNFIEVFGLDNLLIIADNVTQETLKFIKGFTQNIKITNLGNSQSFMAAVDEALKTADDNIVYLIEDDYLHFRGSDKILIEGLDKADYVTLYDHADKYMKDGPNPYVENGGEDTKVILTSSTHWKYTNSTTMTFASRVSTLREDYDIINYFCKGKIPLDFQMFRAFVNSRKRTVLSPIPGMSTHCDGNLSPLINWEEIIVKIRKDDNTYNRVN